MTDFRAPWVILVGIVTLPMSSGAQAEKPPITARIATADQRSSCKYVGLVTAHASMGMDKPSNALKKALRKVQDMGGDSLFIINQTSDWLEGASVNGEALACHAAQ